MRLYRRPPRTCPGELGAWLHRVATNLGYNALRSRSRRESHRDALGHDSAGLGWVTPLADPQAEAERSETRASVRRALSRLRKRDAVLLVLRYGGLSYRQVAEVLRVSPTSIGTLLARAERAFRREYEAITSQDARASDR